MYCYSSNNTKGPVLCITSRCVYEKKGWVQNATHTQKKKMMRPCTLLSLNDYYKWQYYKLKKILQFQIWLFLFKKQLWEMLRIQSGETHDRKMQFFGLLLKNMISNVNQSIWSFSHLLRPLSESLSGLVWFVLGVNRLYRGGKLRIIKLFSVLSSNFTDQ